MFTLNAGNNSSFWPGKGKEDWRYQSESPKPAKKKTAHMTITRKDGPVTSTDSSAERTKCALVGTIFLLLFSQYGGCTQELDYRSLVAKNIDLAKKYWTYESNKVLCFSRFFHFRLGYCFSNCARCRFVIHRPDEMKTYDHRAWVDLVILLKNRSFIKRIWLPSGGINDFSFT